MITCMHVCMHDCMYAYMYVINAHAITDLRPRMAKVIKFIQTYGDKDLKKTVVID